MCFDSKNSPLTLIMVKLNWSNSTSLKINLAQIYAKKENHKRKRN